MSRTYKDIRLDYVKDKRERMNRELKHYNDFYKLDNKSKHNRKTDKSKAIQFELQVA